MGVVHCPTAGSTNSNRAVNTDENLKGRDMKSSESNNESTKDDVDKGDTIVGTDIGVEPVVNEICSVRKVIVPASESPVHIGGSSTEFVDGAKSDGIKHGNGSGYLNKIVTPAGSSHVHIGGSSLEIVEDGNVNSEKPMKVKISALPDSLVSETSTNESVPHKVNGVKEEHVSEAIHAVVDEGGQVEDGKQEMAFEKSVKQSGLKQVSLNNMQRRIGYYLLDEGKVSFSVSDVVWGKVRSHPWWPGQIFGPEDASEMAIKHQKKDHVLVAYFGDKTFGWCDKSKLKPFEPHFLQLEKVCSIDAFVNAVDDALDEIARRVELGMTCSCTPEETCFELKDREIDNAGIREGTLCPFVDKRQITGSFQPKSLIEFVHYSALLPTKVADRLGLVTAQAQLRAFYRAKGYLELPVFFVGGGLVESDYEVLPSGAETSAKNAIESSGPTTPTSNPEMKSRRRKCFTGKTEEVAEKGRKKKSLSEVMGSLMLAKCSKNKNGESTSGRLTSSSAGRRRKVVDIYSQANLVSPSSERKHNAADIKSSTSGKRKRKRLNALGDLEGKTPSSKANRYLKIGEGFRRVASQLRGSSPILKNEIKAFDKKKQKAGGRGMSAGKDEKAVARLESRRKKNTEKDYLPSSELLSQLCLVAKGPSRRFKFLSDIISFFFEFRASIVSNFSYKSSFKEKHIEAKGRKRGRKRSTDVVSSLEMSSHGDYLQDSYFSEESSPEKETLSNGTGRKRKPQQQSRMRSQKSQQSPHHSSGSGWGIEEDSNRNAGSPDVIDESQKMIPPLAEGCTLVLSFNESQMLPSELELNKIFSPYGPLHESETEVLREINQAKIVFRNRSDAEIAFIDAGKDSTFGQALVSYRLEYCRAN